MSQIKPFLRDVIINLQKSGTRKVQLTLKINLISSKDADEEQVTHLKGNHIEFLIQFF